MKTEQTEALTWEWHLTRVYGELSVKRRHIAAAPYFGDVIASGSHEAVQAAKRLLSGEAGRT